MLNSVKEVENSLKYPPIIYTSAYPVIPGCKIVHPLLLQAFLFITAELTVSHQNTKRVQMTQNGVSNEKTICQTSWSCGPSCHFDLLWAALSWIPHTGRIEMCFQWFAWRQKMFCESVSLSKFLKYDIWYDECFVIAIGTVLDTNKKCLNNEIIVFLHLLHQYLRCIHT